MKLPNFRSRFFIITCEIEERSSIISQLKEIDENVGILADRNAITISYPENLESVVGTGLENQPLKEVSLGSPEYLYYFSSSYFHVLFLEPSNEDIREKLRRMLDAINVVPYDDNRVRIQLIDTQTPCKVMSYLVDTLGINSKHEFYDGGKKYVLKVV